MQRQYTPDCLRKRNRYMVDHAEIVLAVWNGSPSGTSQTVWYARETGKPVWIIRPDTLGSAIEGASLRWQRGSFFFVTSQTPLSQLR